MKAFSDTPLNCTSDKSHINFLLMFRTQGGEPQLSQQSPLRKIKSMITMEGKKENFRTNTMKSSYKATRLCLFGDTYLVFISVFSVLLNLGK